MAKHTSHDLDPVLHTYTCTGCGQVKTEVHPKGLLDLPIFNLCDDCTKKMVQETVQRVHEQFEAGVGRHCVPMQPTSGPALRGVVPAGE